MSDLLGLVCILGVLGILDVTAMLFGHDSRDGFQFERSVDYPTRSEFDDEYS